MFKDYDTKSNGSKSNVTKSYGIKSNMTKSSGTKNNYVNSNDAKNNGNKIIWYKEKLQREQFGTRINGILPLVCIIPLFFILSTYKKPLIYLIYSLTDEIQYCHY